MSGDEDQRGKSCVVRQKLIIDDCPLLSPLLSTFSETTSDRTSTTPSTLLRSVEGTVTHRHDGLLPKTFNPTV